MSTVIFYITENGLNLAKRLRRLYPEARIEKFNSNEVSDLWDKHKNLIFIMAAGIVVRTIAPLIKNKKTDPAVVVLDETGKYAISLLSGHIGGANDLAKDIAEFLKGEAVITTASDVNNLTAIDIWANENNLSIENMEIMPHVATRYINNGALRIYSEIEIALPDEFLRVNDPRFADVFVTNKKDIYLKNPQCSSAECSTGSCHVKEQLYLRPKNLIAGIGCNSNTSSDEMEDAVRTVLDENNLSFLAIHSIATIYIKGNEQGLKAFAEKYNLKINTFTADELNTVEGILKSDAVFKATGANAVSEPAALLASGASELLIPKHKRGNVTVAIAEQRLEQKGKLYIVGTGPGGIEHITPYAQKAIKNSDVIVGYGTYLDLIQELTEGKEVVSTGMTKEVDRCKKAVELATTGKTVAVISGGDPGIYAMAGLVFEILREEDQKIRRSEDEQITEEKTSVLPRFCASALDIEVIPGISALNACAARLGAPLMHDFAAISLSDRLTPWELIEKRLAAAASADFVTILYNPKSMGRPEHINNARAIFLKHRSTETPVGIVKGAMRENESIIITNLRDMLNYDIDMQTAVIIGNSRTFVFDKWMITPRGYENKYEF
ncbi:MAG: precorrin-3B C(17)-methyltransferase [Nitrospirae bacterium]|nr:precorrin-3B C(17)-methyltransferase [Nitrospirota bacterium]MCL5978751.1 precorrin-3B C(17)-methyltransferase [Nitrospirota bacterium]